jgi:hypothetical protein
MNARAGGSRLGQGRCGAWARDHSEDGGAERERCRCQDRGAEHRGARAYRWTRRGVNPRFADRGSQIRPITKRSDKLAEGQYLDIVAFDLKANGVDPTGQTISPDGLTGIGCIRSPRWDNGVAPARAART